jgi:hypothetical protein
VNEEIGFREDLSIERTLAIFPIRVDGKQRTLGVRGSGAAFCNPQGAVFRPEPTPHGQSTICGATAGLETAQPLEGLSYGKFLFIFFLFL